MKITLLDFIKTGKFGTVQVGQSLENILDTFPLPDDIWDADNDTYIWSYSVFEFHFISGQLTLLWCDNLSYLENPDKKQFELDKWLLDEPNNMTFSYFCSLLDKEDIKYSLRGSFFTSEEQKLPDNVILSVNGADTEIYFEDTEEKATSISEYNLVAIGATQFKPKYKVYPL
ncbi:MAG: hypothetical protein LBV71_04050 [Prevotella sp.]|jgi:hypothetical protein|nr:hypothetical protein [Prevotella sp.]MDR3056786.1 hypothetical protein [Prevotella sp.]